MVEKFSLLLQDKSSTLNDDSRGKVDLRCLLGLTNNLPLPREDEFPFTIKLKSCKLSEQKCVSCQDKVSYDTKILSNDMTVITTIYPQGEDCLKNKI